MQHPPPQHFFLPYLIFNIYLLLSVFNCKANCAVLLKFADMEIHFDIYFHSLLFLIYSFLPKQVKTQNPEFTRDCNDPLLLNHDNKFSHSYCFHVCGFPQDPTTAICTSAGTCVCAADPCSDDDAVLAASAGGKFDNSLCPPMASDAPDPNPNAEPACGALCAGQCAGGIGKICGEIEVLGPMMNVYAKVCTCSCPTQRCTPLTTTTLATTTTTTTSTTSTTSPTTATTTSSVALFVNKFKIFKILWKIKLVTSWAVQKLAKYVIVVFKLFLAYAIQWIFLGTYFFVMKHLIALELGLLFEWIWWIFAIIKNNF